MSSQATFEPVSAKTQPVSGHTTCQIPDIENSCSRDSSRKTPPRWEAPDFPRQRPAHCPLTLGNVGGSPTPGNHTAETGLAGWGARIRTWECRIRTWEWRNQNPPVPPLISTVILKNRRNSIRHRHRVCRFSRSPASPRRCQLSAFQRAEAIERRAAGETLADIAKSCGRREHDQPAGRAAGPGRTRRGVGWATIRRPGRPSHAGPAPAYQRLRLAASNSIFLQLCVEPDIPFGVKVRARVSAVEREEAAARTSAASTPQQVGSRGSDFARNFRLERRRCPNRPALRWRRPNGVSTRNFVPIESGGCLVPKDSELLALASGWRARAEELLLQAETMNDADARLRIRGIAAGYQRMAERAEQRSREAEATPPRP